jgi:hypothetical protein
LVFVINLPTKLYKIVILFLSFLVIQWRSVNASKSAQVQIVLPLIELSFSPEFLTADREDVLELKLIFCRKEHESMNN